MGPPLAPNQKRGTKCSLLLDQWHPLFEEDMLFLHKATVDLEQESLGIQFSGTQLGCGITRRRFWRLCAAIEDLLHRRKCYSWVINAIVGRATFCCLSERPLLSIPHTVCKFIRSSYSKLMNIWTEVRSEMCTSRCTMLFLWTDWWTPWSTCVSKADSSLEGLETMIAQRLSPAVAKVAIIPERLRFTGVGAHPARERAFVRA